MTDTPHLKLIRYCETLEEYEWVKDRTVEDAWNECSRINWMLGWVCRTGVDRLKVGGAVSAVVREVLPRFESVRPDDRRVRELLDACDRYAAGEYVDLIPYESRVLDGRPEQDIPAAYYASNAAVAASTAFRSSVRDLYYYAVSAVRSADSSEYVGSYYDETYMMSVRDRNVAIIRSKITADDLLTAIGAATKGSTNVCADSGPSESP